MRTIEEIKDRNRLWDMLRLYVSERGLIEKIRKGLPYRKHPFNFSIDNVMTSLENKSYPPSYITSLNIKHFFDDYLSWMCTDEGFRFWLKEQMLFSSILYQLCPTDIALGSYVVKNLASRPDGEKCLPQKYFQKINMLYNIHNKANKNRLIEN